ncbi:hypothetical protein N510_000170 [Firmicutes bacterium ASF500]|nr:hypothetical protein N510_000170 [Firmicutes bacterium ASF500]
MSVKSQEKNMRKLADLLRRDLSYIWGEREGGPNGDKRVFLNTGKTFLRALTKDLGLVEYNVSANPGGIAVTGETTLIGMWGNSGIYIQIEQPCYDRERVLLYRTVRYMKDYTGGHNHFLCRRDLEVMSYNDLLRVFI